ncbi:Protein mak11 [Exophiala dermatitidis]|uniref:Protein MAK11 n=2 Tax=Exophiala dermatitidis TaxID=5970 RepID=H6BN13_EXODN|nr:uncharacterized protein HMPREF1120_00354 [Exophiala dermatitidis NIH/UT8656]KAJ4514792.1 Protein mak11 [Exophiala dermatitidis]EHY52137.1 hypothetical protein HMPREF1120_00354 [Exophiala dermatitidis NIH/UT8656]KAJ4518249.1 Protein mak11 [Exophiala dermatitidis]KAJ4521147.1 Protein mak11 [Exophiala dermatitidis]KAJ4547735.1 Protein mak11 [Exophiala dermatitidis]
MVKRKRGVEAVTSKSTSDGQAETAKVTKTNGHIDVKTAVPVIQIVAGSYERVLHGITATISDLSSSKSSPSVQFTDSFLFNAHASGVRCLALSPMPGPESSENQSVYLATGGSDEKINVYSLSASPVASKDRIPMPSLGNNAISEDPRNRELGTLMHHSSSITALHFPTRSKLLSGSEDNTIAVTRLKDLTVVSTIKAPRPKVQGQPSGDTAPPGATPAGINDFAVHPSLKLMLSVGRGERCMRLWNLVTGKKAGVLNFNRDVLQSVKESKYSSGEGRKIRWHPDGAEFAVAFERGAVVFGEDSKAKCKVLPEPLTKLHQMSYLSLSISEKEELAMLVVSTEDGRVLFYRTDELTKSAANGTSGDSPSIPNATLCASVGGRSAGVNNRIKDFEVLFLPGTQQEQQDLGIVAASSDGTIRIFHISSTDILTAIKSRKHAQLGTVIGSYETGNRITCLKAFVMLPPSTHDDELGDEDSDFGGFDGTEEESEGESSSEDD